MVSSYLILTHIKDSLAAFVCDGYINKKQTELLLQVHSKLRSTMIEEAPRLVRALNVPREDETSVFQALLEAVRGGTQGEQHLSKL